MRAIIGGSGLDQLPGLALDREEFVETPYGEPSAPLQYGRYADTPVIFLARHGTRHTLPPHAINYRANLWALQAAGVSSVIAVAAVGGIRADMTPGCIAVPDQIIDYSWGRAHSFHDGGAAELAHVEFDPPYDEALRRQLLDAASAAGVACVADGTYACTQGPRLETAAEVRRLQRDGCDVVGMTGMPEAVLARELGMAYACIAVSVNWAAGLGESGQGIHAQIEVAMRAGMDKTQVLLQAVLRSQTR